MYDRVCDGGVPAGGVVSEDMSVVDARRAVLVASLERLGWTLVNAEVDVGRETARIELRSGERLVTLDVRNGRATLTRERAGVETVTVGRRGDITRVDRLKTEFVGRQKFATPAEAAKALVDYAVDNGSSSGELYAGVVLAMLMGGD
jgi:hypothetical protein